MDKVIRFSVIMPTYNQCSFIRRAILSLMQQTYPHWELIIVNDGCTDETEDYIRDYLTDERITYIKNDENQGLGRALNQGLDAARYDYIAYLPSDDFYFENHLESIAFVFASNRQCSLVYSGIQYETRDSLHGSPEIETTKGKRGFSLQLVQVAHIKNKECWVERDEWICDNLFDTYWKRLTPYGEFSCTNTITAYWTQHPLQRHLIINEKYGGGINKVRSYYRIKNPIKIKVAQEKFINEQEIYKNFRKRQTRKKDSLKILLVGELAYNPERIYAFEEAGHKLYGLWMPVPHLSFSTVGPLPFGNVEDLDINCWHEEIERIKPDIIYAMLNWGVIPFAYDVIKAFPQIPFAWHYKEGPQLAISMGLWPRLIYLYTHATLKIYLNETTKKWYEQFIPDEGLSFIMDGDLPKRDYFNNNFTEKISQKDGEIHTVCAGRLIGIGEYSISVLASEKIHIHLYLENFHATRAGELLSWHQKFPDYFHIHNHCQPNNWVREFSQYDAGWLHCIQSTNGGNLLKATWDDLNIPARISTYMAAGLPVLLPNGNGSTVAVEEIIKKQGTGILFNDFHHLASCLREEIKSNEKRNNVMKYRDFHCFDHYVDSLICMFHKAIEIKKNECYK